MIFFIFLTFRTFHKPFRQIFLFLLIAGAIVGPSLQAATPELVGTFESKSGTCIEDLENDTIAVENNALLFGGNISFCPALWQGIQGRAQLVLCLDQSGSMKGTDPDRKAVDVAKTFIDSLAVLSPESKIGLVLFSSIHSVSKAQSFPPVSLKDTASIAALKAAIDTSGKYIGPGTAYGAALDSTLALFESLPADSNRAVIFLSDGKPWVSGSDKAYKEMISTGRIQDLPPVHTVYFHTGSGSSTARDTLNNLALITGGTFTDVSNAEYLYTTFLDSLTAKVIPPFNLEKFYLMNYASEEKTFGVVLDTNPENPVVAFPPLYLLGEWNTMLLVYQKQTDQGPERVIKSFVVHRKNSALSPAEESRFHTYFSKTETPGSRFRFLANGNELTLPAFYDSTHSQISIQVERGAGIDSVVEMDSVRVVTASGDTEWVAVTETEPASNRFEGGMPFCVASVAIPQNGVLEVWSYDTLLALYSNYRLASNEYRFIDQSTGEAWARYGGTDAIKPYVDLLSPQTKDEWFTGSKQEIRWSASDNVGIARFRLYYRTHPDQEWTVLDSCISSEDRSWTWTLPSDPAPLCWVKVSAVDMEGNEGYDTSDLAFHVVARPHFTSPESVYVSQNRALSYKVRFHTHSKDRPVLRYLSKPFWAVAIDDSVSGTMPSLVKSAEIVVTLTSGGFSDTLSVWVSYKEEQVHADPKPARQLPERLSIEPRRVQGTWQWQVRLPHPGSFKIRLWDATGKSIWVHERAKAAAGTYRIPMTATQRAPRVAAGFRVVELLFGPQRIAKRVVTIMP